MPKTGLSSEQMRCKAVSVTLDMMREQGFEKVRLSNVARAIGISHAALYAHFKDKEALLDAVIQDWLEDIDKRAAAALTTTDDHEGKVVKWFLARYQEKRQRALTDPEMYRAYNLAAAGDKASAAHHFARMRAQLADLLNDAGLGNEKEAALLLDAMQAYNHPALIVARSDIDQTDNIRALLKIFFLGLKNKRDADP